MARTWDWPLIFVTCALTAAGIVLVWAATAPSLRAVGLDPHTYLKKAALWGFLGLILMFITASIDYRRIRRLAPALYGLSLLLLVAVLAAASRSTAPRPGSPCPAASRLSRRSSPSSG